MAELSGVKVVEIEEECPYLPEKRAVLPFYVVDFREDSAMFDDALANGARRSGVFTYQTKCPNCQACQPIRIPIADFEFRRRQRRVLKRAEDKIRVEIGTPVVDQARVDLYNRHKVERGLGQPDSETDADSLSEFLGITCCESLEFRYFHQQQLIGAAVVDIGQKAMSAVYCYFDTKLSHFSIGTLSILKQIEACRTWDLDYLYLGFFVADNPHMQYKSSFLPHERKIDGSWTRFDPQQSN